MHRAVRINTLVNVYVLRDECAGTRYVNSMQIRHCYVARARGRDFSKSNHRRPIKKQLEDVEPRDRSEDRTTCVEREPNLGNNSTEATKDNGGRGRWLVVTATRRGFVDRFI